MKKIALIVLLVALTIVSFSIYGEKIGVIYAESTSLVNKEYYGTYTGLVKTEWLKDGRNMRLLETFTYVDPKGVEWMAPAGFVVDGASIPQIVWSDVGGPYEGKYRDASVIHDAACYQKLRSWKSVHLAFYNAMRASGVDPKMAKVFYWAVYHYCPRWEIRSELKTILRSTASEIKNKIQSEVGSSSQVEIIERKIVKYQPEKVDATVVVILPKRQLKDSDFAKAKAHIMEMEYSGKGPMSLEEIQGYLPAE